MLVIPCFFTDGQSGEIMCNRKLRCSMCLYESNNVNQYPYVKCVLDRSVYIVRQEKEEKECLRKVRRAARLTFARIFPEQERREISEIWQ